MLRDRNSEKCDKCTRGRTKDGRGSTESNLGAVPKNRNNVMMVVFDSNEHAFLVFVAELGLLTRFRLATPTCRLLNMH